MLKLKWYHDTQGLKILIPSIKGDRYLKQPVGHHRNKLSQFILDTLDVDCDSEGYLHLNYSSLTDSEALEIVKIMAKFLGKEFDLEPTNFYLFMNTTINSK